MPSSLSAPLCEALSPELVAALRDRSPDTDSSPVGPETMPTDEQRSVGPATPPPPPEPTTLAEAGLGEALVDALLLKTLRNLMAATSASLARQVRLSRRIVGDALERLRKDLLVTIKHAAEGNDYVFQLTEAGSALARQHSDTAQYADAAPVPLAAYERAIRRQSLGASRVGLDDLRAALAGLTIDDELVVAMAQSLVDGRGLFLYGSPGNGKTTLAERLVDAFGKHLWIPRTVCVGSDLLRVYDPAVHEAVESPELERSRYDRRWVLIRRPTVVVGGELTLEQLEPSFHAHSGVSEAPVQMKANGGALVIDDFGRQRASSTEILNRLIVPLEKQFDYLSLSSGRQARTPFDLLFVLSTNLEPRSLVDEAFLRRIPYKVEVRDPTEGQFRKVFGDYAGSMGVRVAAGAIDWLLAEHYAPTGRPMRFCHPRDLLRQAKNFCVVHGREPIADFESLGAAVRNYFAGI